jgi:CheY-like chemotaxis protein
LELIDAVVSGFDCFILDVQMPGMDGIELCGQIRAIEVYKDTPIIMNTAVADRDYIDAAFAAGATDYLTKPVDEVEVKARLGVIENSSPNACGRRSPCRIRASMSSTRRPTGFSTEFR